MRIYFAPIFCSQRCLAKLGKQKPAKRQVSVWRVGVPLFQDDPQVALVTGNKTLVGHGGIGTDGRLGRSVPYGETRSFYYCGWNFFTEMLESAQKRRIGCNILKNALPAPVADE